MLRRVARDRTDVSEGHICSITRVEAIRELKTFTVASNIPSSLILSTLVIAAICTYETSTRKGITRRHFPEDDILQLLKLTISQVTVASEI
jgi:hypothetical protein